jgi:uncharacterized protein (DUF2164 family)
MMKVCLSADRRAALLESLIAYYATEFDETLSPFRAESLLDFFVRNWGLAQAPLRNRSSA